ncbi:MAG: hypothetical protein V4754_02315 [Pseudomonadota bacterium]
MKKCIIDGLEVDVNLIRSNSIAFGKSLGVEFAVPFHLQLDAHEAITAFGAYYQDFIDRESEDEGFDETLGGHFLLLKETGYLSFEAMVFEQPELLAQVIINELPAEFLGYIFLDPQASVESKKYILQNLKNVSISDGTIACFGNALLNPRHSI